MQGELDDATVKFAEAKAVFEFAHGPFHALATPFSSFTAPRAVSE